MYEKDFVFRTIGPGILGHRDVCGRSSNPVRELDCFRRWVACRNGSTQLTENQSLNVTISEQKDRLFTGNMPYMENGTEVVESFAGAIGLDDKTLYIAESNEGYDLGTIISDNDIELIYLQDGKMGDLEIDKLHRIKA